MAVCNTPPHYRVYRKNRRFPLFPRKNFHLIYNMGVAGLQYRPCRARGETRQAPRRPGGAEKRPRRGGRPRRGSGVVGEAPPPTPAGRKMPPLGGQFVTNCPSKRLRGGKNSRFSTKNRRENDNLKIKNLTTHKMREKQVGSCGIKLH